ncbi:MAG: radical SAM protein [Oscillospiraceae bacterium]|nr:radical SAM protein [Oscillospiraceae bacterium]
MTARKSIIPVFIPHLGCPHDCVFCNQKRISGSLLPATAEDVKRSIEDALCLCEGQMQLAFYGGSFTAMPISEQIKLLEAVKPYIASGAVSDIRLSTRPDAINDGILDMLCAYGVSTIELGSQSMDDEVLRLSGRGHTSEDTRHSADLIKRKGFKLVLQMMTGLPGSNDEKDIKTAEKLADLMPDAVRIYPTVIIRDTALFDVWQAGRYDEHTVEDAVRVCAQILPIFESRRISVIRLGLNPTDDLSGGDAAGGAYHPALGELVKSRIYYNKALHMLEGVETNSDIVLGVNKSQISQMIGQHRSNISKLREVLHANSIKVIESAVNIGEILIVSVAKNSKTSYTVM